MKQLDEENKLLKALVADLSLEKQMLQDVLSKCSEYPPESEFPWIICRCLTRSVSVAPVRCCVWRVRRAATGAFLTSGLRYAADCVNWRQLVFATITVGFTFCCVEKAGIRNAGAIVVCRLCQEEGLAMRRRVLAPSKRTGAMVKLRRRAKDRALVQK
jgi:hypothetical protein